MTNKAIRLFLAVAATAALTACGGSGTTTTIPVTSITIFNGHSVAFNNHSAMLWGYNGSGQLGNGVTNTSYTPVTLQENGKPVHGLAGISAGSAHTLAFFNNSTVHAWGANFSGQLGNNTVSNGVLSPVRVVFKNTSSLRGVVAVSAGEDHSLALLNNSTVWAWGANYAGQLGDNTTTNRSFAVQVKDQATGSPLTGVTAIAAGGGHSLALVGGEVWSWGANDISTTNSQVSITESHAAPVRVMTAAGTPLNNIKLIATGGLTSVAVDNSDKVWVWGLNDFGQLGFNPGTVPPHSFDKVPRQIGGGLITGSIKAVSVGLGHILVLAQNGSTWTLWGWGFNGYGQLGGVSKDITPTEIVTTPRAVTGLSGSFDPAALTVNGMSPILAIGNHSLAKTSTGLWAWGNNNYGQLGVAPDNTRNFRAEPQQITGF